MFRRPRSLRPLLATSIVLVGALALAGCTDSPGSVPTPDPVAVGSWPSAEPALLSETIAALLRAEGLTATVTSFSDAESARQALELGDVDVLPGYTGAAWLQVLERSDPPSDAQTSFARVREFDEQRGLIWLRPRFDVGGDDVPPADATFALFVAGPPVVDSTIRSISQLASRLSEDVTAQLCLDEDFARRVDGRDAVFRAYGLSLERQDISASPSDAMLAVQRGDCLAGLATTTDGLAWNAGLQALNDDLSVFPAFVIAAVVDQGTLARTGVATALGPFSSQLTSRLVAEHNGAVRRGRAVDQVASELASLLRARAGRVGLPAG